MKARRLVVGLLGILATVTRIAYADTLYGATAGGPGELWTLNPANGGGLQNIGPLDNLLGANFAVSGLAFDPITGVLYGSTDISSGQSLLRIDPTDGQVTVVGAFNAPGGGTMAGIAFDSAGNLYGITSAGGANLCSININTGHATEIGPSGELFTVGGGLSISPTGIFYCVPEGDNFGTIDPTTGVYSFIGTSATPAGAGSSYSALAFDSSGTLYGIDLGETSDLVTFDLNTGAIDDLGTSVPQVDAIAFAPVPEPASAALFLGGIAALLGCKCRKASIRGVV